MRPHITGALKAGATMDEIMLMAASGPSPKTRPPAAASGYWGAAGALLTLGCDCYFINLIA
jgi:hypothetical protein